MKGCATGNILDGIVADAARVRESFVEVSKDFATEHVGRVHRVACRAKALDQQAQSLRKALRVMEEQDLGHHSSVRLETQMRDPWAGESRRWGPR